MNSLIMDEINNSISVKKDILQDKRLIDTINIISEKAISICKNNGKLMLAGNGGSASDAQHIAGELVGKKQGSKIPISALSLVTDTSVISAIANDFGYNYIFSKQIESIGKRGDMFIGISTSGKSINIIEALKVCKFNSIITVGLTGSEKTDIDDLCDYCIKIPSTKSRRIQEAHILIGHIFCRMIKNGLGYSLSY